MSDIFISYANEDREKIRPLAHALEARGWSVFWDPNIPAGKSWRDVLDDALKDARCVVVAWSSHSIVSRWVHEEAEEGRERSILVPVLLEQVRLPLGFRGVQAADLSDWDHTKHSDAFERLLADIDAHLGSSRGETSEADEASRAAVEDGKAVEATTSSALEFSPPDRPSVAILPFKSLGSDPDQDYLADGIRYGISASLVQLSGLFLVHAPVLNAYRGKDVSARSVGEELGARYVLEGAVQQAANRVRVTVQLTDVDTNRISFADRYDRVVDDIFELQDEITREVISSLNIELLANESGRVWFGKITVPEAKEFYYRGASHFYELNKDDNAKARHYFEELYRVQPDSVVGPSYVSMTHWIDAFFEWTNSSAKSREQASIWAQKAMEYEDNNGIGHAVFGYLQLLEGKYDDALANCSTGVKLRTSCPMAHALLGIVLNFCGDAGLAVKSVREALQLERVYPTWLIDVLAAAYRDSGAVDLSIPAAIESLRLNPKSTAARLILCSDYQLAANHEQARRVADEVIASEPEFRLSTYAKSQPYRDPATLERLLATLREAGLPQ